jgi:thymidylate synthase (FAD)
MNYLPTVERLMANSTKNKQAGTVAGAEDLSVADAEEFQGFLRDHYKTVEVSYQTALASGVPKELARIHLPVARYSRMMAKANLRNWLGFLTLRMDAHAQYEIRVYAEAVGQMIQEKFPRTWALFVEGKS